jgi:hypothetical protein
MAQADFIVSNGTGAAVRSDLNVQFAAIVSNNSGATEPATMYAYQWWADTTAGLLKLRNSANSAWITMRQLDGEFSTVPVENGTAAAPSIFFKDSGTDTGLFSPGADQVAVATNGTGRLFVDSSGRVGVGTSTTTFGGNAFRFAVLGTKTYSELIPRDGLAIADNTATAQGVGGSITFHGIYDGSTNYTAFGGIEGQKENGTSGNYAGALVLKSRAHSGNLNEAMRIDSSARLLVGTSSAARSNVYQSALNITPQNQIESNKGDYSGGLSLINCSAGGYSAVLTFGQSFTNTLGGNGLTTNGQPLGIINFTGNDGTNFRTAARISGETDAVTGSGDMPGRIVLATTADGASSPTERMRITSGGNLLFAKTTTGLGNDGLELQATGSGGAITITNSGNGTNNLVLNSRYGAGTQYPISFRFSAAEVGYVSVTSTATAYNTSSDYRLKENVVPLTGAADRVNQLQVHRFNFIADPTKTVDGFLAHEVQSIVPEAITGEKDAVDDEGNPKYQGIDQSKLVPLLTAALQEAITKIESLEARLTAAGL